MALREVAPARAACLLRRLLVGPPCHKLLGSSLEVLQLLLSPLLLFAQRLDLLKAVGELLFGVGNHLLHPLNIICAVIQHILYVSKQLFFIC
jgi:hypothetical protein